VGQNEFVSDAPEVEVMKIDPRIEREQVERLRAWRAAHDTPAKAESLAAIEAAAKGSLNLLPPTLAAVKAGATVGEISDVLRGVWGEHRETLTI
jgi:methylmalonyl-CoA mutase N-terminal domain/subunit